MIHKYKLLFLSLIPTLIVVFILVDQRNAHSPVSTITPPSNQAVLGTTSNTQSHFNDVPISVLPTSIAPSVLSSPTPETLAITYLSAQADITEGDTQNFTWDINGPAQTIHSTTIYYGTTGSHGTLTSDTSPQNTLYTDWVNDFVTGDFFIPLRFVGNAQRLSPGTYFYRAYALIGGKHVWSQEQSFIVRPVPHHTMHMINYPTSLFVGASATFTWDIDGPTTTTGFTAIVGGNSSKPGPLDPSINLGMTPYTMLVSDFTQGSYDIPLRFVGNAVATDPGIYYFRALAYINGKNIWSDEYSFTVK